MTLQERLKQEAALLWHGPRACLPGLLHETSARITELEQQLADSLSALSYIESTQGRVYGVGWDRIDEYRRLSAGGPERL